MKERLRTVRGYDFGECSSAMQKAVRRADARLAGYWAIELWESGFDAYVWRRLLTISAEDVWGIITFEVEALMRSYEKVNQGAKEKRGRIFVAKAVILLCLAKKSRDADHLTNLVYDGRNPTDAEIDAEIDAARALPEAIPDYAYDFHTVKGRTRGATKAQFFRTEYDALQPRQQGLFDNLAAVGVR